MRHEREVHKLHGQGPQAYPVHNHSADEKSDENSVPSLLKVSRHRGDAAYKLHQPPEDIDDYSVQDRDHPQSNEVRDNDDASEHMEGAHVLVHSAAVDGRTSPLDSNDNDERHGLDLLDTHLKPKHTVTSGSRHHPRRTSIPASKRPEQPKEDKGKIMVDVDFLHRLESKISDLQSRVEECEGTPSSPTTTSICDSRGSVNSVSDLGHVSIRAAKDSCHIDDDKIIDGPEVKKGKRGGVNVEGPSLAIARRKCVGNNPMFEAVDGGIYSRRIVEDLGDRPLLALVEEHLSNGKFWRKRMEIASPDFFDLLKEVSGHDMDENALQEGVFYLLEPFRVLFLNRKQLTDYAKDTNESTQAKKHAKFVLDFLKSDFSDISRALDNFESVTPPNLVRYCDLWMLYRPGTTVYSCANGEWEAFIVDSFHGMQERIPSPDNRHSLTRLDIDAWSINFDGEVYGRVWSIHCVAPFHGVKNISSLPLVPEKFLLDGKIIRDSLIFRGRKFCALQVQHCQENETSPSRVVVDHLTYQRRNGFVHFGVIFPHLRSRSES